MECSYFIRGVKVVNKRILCIGKIVKGKKTIIVADKEVIKGKYQCLIKIDI